MSLPALAKSPDNVTLAERVNVLIRAYNQTLRIAQELVSETGAVATGTTQIPIDDTIPQNTEGDQYLSLAITPTNALSTFKVRAGGGGASTTTFNGSGGARLLGGVYASSITIRERLPAS
jgi:hypothetical protein